MKTKRKGTFQRGCLDVRAFLLSIQLSEMESSLNILQKGIWELQKPWVYRLLVLFENRKARWAKAGGEEIKKFRVGWGWRGNEGGCWRASPAAGSWEECGFTLKEMGRCGGGGFGQQQPDLTWVLKTPLTALLGADRIWPRAEAGSSVGERCKVQRGVKVLGLGWLGCRWWAVVRFGDMKGSEKSYSQKPLLSLLCQCFKQCWLLFCRTLT